MADNGVHTRDNRQVSIAVVSVGLVCLLVYLRALSCGFINLDDPVYVINNSAIRKLDASLVVSAFTKPYYFGWLPLTYISFAVDYHFWKLNPFGYHLTNILLHSVNSGLVVLIAHSFCRLKIPPFKAAMDRTWLYPAMLALTGLLFGLHPLRVEAVTWVSQRKDVLNGLFFLGAILFYLRYVQKKDLSGERAASTRNYLISLGLFLCSLMAKQVSVVLPVLLLVVDWYPLGRVHKGNIRRILLEKLPYFAISVLISLTTIYFASQGNVMITAEDFPYYARVLVSGNAVFEYCRLWFYPAGIVPLFVIGDEIRISFIVKTVAVIVFTCACIYNARKRPLLCVTWFSFLLPLLPVLAFTQTADDTAFASRYTYLPSVVPSIVAGFLLAGGYLAMAEVKPKLSRIVFPVLIVALIIGCGAMTIRLVSAWENPKTLWTRQIKIQPLGRAYTFCGIYCFSIGKYAAALDEFSKSLKIAQQAGREDLFNILAYRGETLRAMGRHEEAIEDFTAAISMSPHPQYYYFRGCSLQALGMMAEAAEDFRRAGKQTGPITWFPAGGQ